MSTQKQTNFVSPNYFYDTEFIEGKQLGSRVPTIDLISIGIVDSHNNSLYLICNEFNLSEAWHRNDGTFTEPRYWIRENVLEPLYEDLCKIQRENPNQYDFTLEEFNQENLSWLLQKHGKGKEYIAKEVLKFINPSEARPVNLIGYYSGYDHVVLCWLFGRMIDLPKGMPFYTTDLKQEIDRIADRYLVKTMTEPIVSSDWHQNYALDNLKHDFPTLFPNMFGRHSSIDDARAVLEMYLFIKFMENEVIKG